MKFRTLITAAAMFVLPIVASAATLIIPAAGTGAGANGSRWQTELTLHNASGKSIPLTLYFHDSNGRSSAVAVNLPARSTDSIDDVVRTQFHREQATGALTIEVADADLHRIAVTSRTFNDSQTGQFGQDIPAVETNAAADAGEMAVIAGPSSAGEARFNFGLFAITDTTVRWELIRSNGTVAQSVTRSYTGATQVQHVAGVETLFNATPNDSDTVHAIVTSGSAIFYGSAINNATGDPAYVQGVLTRDDIRIAFAGLDLDENGTIDARDADNDGVVDSTIDIKTSLFPDFLRVVAAGENGEKVTLALISSPADAVFVDDNGTLQVAPTANLRGTTGEMKVRATTATSTAVLTIPVRFY
ncbi:MAG TPA: hypothetical protein VF698_14475 [Thermoanaerobaculia bacterium]